MDEDLAGQDAKDLYDVSGQTCQSRRHLFKYLLVLLSTSVSTVHANGSYSGNMYDLHSISHIYCL